MTVIDARIRLPWDRRPLGERDKPSAITDRYDALLGTVATRRKTTDDLLDDMENAGVGQAIVHAEFEHGAWADELNQAVADMVNEYPRRFRGFGTVDLLDLRPRRAVNQLRDIAGLGLLGLNIQPAFFGLPLNDCKLYPIYAAAEDMGLPVAIHTGINYSTNCPMGLEHPMLLDEIACAFPDLQVIACHAGWPWVLDIAAVARRHAKVMVDFGGLAPKYIGQQDTGWAPMFRMMDSLLASQVLYASDWPVFPMDRALDEWRALPLKAQTMSKLTSWNLTRLLGSFGAASDQARGIGA